MNTVNTHPQTGARSVPQRNALRENIEAILVAVALALFIRTFVVQAFKIPSGSMKDTLLIGDHILVNKFTYGIKIPYLDKNLLAMKKPARGDIVVFRYPLDPEKDFIKRVVGVAGDEILIRDKMVYVNGNRQTGDYIRYMDPHVYPARENTRDNFGPVTVPPDSLFVMGDNRDNSHDSRFWGFVPFKDLRGKAFIIYMSWDSENSKNFLNYIRWNRLFRVLK
jgi:signal peptidase I